jgi:hypothetical protein
MTQSASAPQQGITINTGKDLPEVGRPMVYVDPGFSRGSAVKLCVRWAGARVDVILPALDAQAIGWAVYTAGLGKMVSGDSGKAA